MTIRDEVTIWKLKLDRKKIKGVEYEYICNFNGIVPRIFKEFCFNLKILYDVRHKISKKYYSDEEEKYYYEGQIYSNTLTIEEIKQKWYEFIENYKK